ncbi:MAG TPA: hypothetical protein VNR64_01075 [Vicinamibacterales bacterium]|nr:hypothetical protein [Vicinamibacterales bacterium]
MGNRYFWRGLAAALIVVAGAAAIAIGAYNAGVAHGIVASGQAFPAPPAGTPYIYGWPHPWGFGFFPFFPILFLFFLFFVLRGLLWRGPWRGGWGCRYGGVPPAFDEWHRRAHAEQPGSTTPSGRTT